MNLYLRSVGFRDYTPQDVDGLVGRAISAAMKTGSLMKKCQIWSCTGSVWHIRIHRGGYIRKA